MTETIPTLDELLEDLRGVAAPAGQPNRFDAKRLEQRETERLQQLAARDYRRLAAKPANTELRAWLKSRLHGLIEQISTSQVGNPDPLASTFNTAISELRELLEMTTAAQAMFGEAVALAAHHAVQHGHFPRIRTLVEIIQPEDPEVEVVGASSSEQSLPRG